MTRRASGHCEPAFAAMRDIFEAPRTWPGANPEGGGAVAVWRDGRLVADLWTGEAEPGRPWAEDTIVCEMSVAKGVSALCIHLLADRGLVDLDAPIARTWPEFAANGKDAILVRHALDHTAGLPDVSAPVTPREALAWEPMIRALEAEAPHSAPGTVPAYHSVTMGYLLGEIVRRVTGMTIGTFFRREIGEPLGLDYWIGLPPEQHGRCARIGGNLHDGLFGAYRRAPESRLGRAMRQIPVDILNEPEFRSAEVPSINGHGTPRAVATLFGQLAARPGAILSEPALARATTLQWQGNDATMGHRRAMAMGFILADPDVPMGTGRAFGHTGAGGSIGFGDPDLGIGICFTTNDHYSGPGLNPWMIATCEAALEAARRIAA